MYEIQKKSGTKDTYLIVIRGTAFGTVSYTLEGKWVAKLGNISITQKSRRKAVENALYQIITNQIKGEKLECTNSL